MKENMVEVVAQLEEITRLQAEVINDLFELLGQYVTAEELDHLPTIDKINEAAAIRMSIGGQGLLDGARPLQESAGKENDGCWK